MTLAEQGVEQAVALLFIWGALMPVWRQCEEKWTS